MVSFGPRSRAHSVSRTRRPIPADAERPGLIAGAFFGQCRLYADFDRENGRPSEPPLLFPTDFLGIFGGAGRDRTDDLSSAIAALSQLSYGPIPGQVSDISYQISRGNGSLISDF